MKPIWMNLSSTILALALTVASCSGGAIKEESPDGSDPVGHQLFEKVLERFVNDEGYVDYKGLKENRGDLEAYLEKLRQSHPDKDSWSREERLAYWINAYNAFTLDLVLGHYPVESIKDIGSPWDIKFITIEGKEYSLNDIEHRILRKNYDEPRIHFAVNCASISCPVLLNEPYEAVRVDEQLETQARRFINDPQRNEVSADQLELSRIFKWYKDDFTKNGSLPSYIDRFTDIDVAGDASVDYLDYNWHLNEQR